MISPFAASTNYSRLIKSFSAFADCILLIYSLTAFAYYIRYAIAFAASSCFGVVSSLQTRAGSNKQKTHRGGWSTSQHQYTEQDTSKQIATTRRSEQRRSTQQGSRDPKQTAITKRQISRADRNNQDIDQGRSRQTGRKQMRAIRNKTKKDRDRSRRPESKAPKKIANQEPECK